MKNIMKNVIIEWPLNVKSITIFFQRTKRTSITDPMLNMSLYYIIWSMTSDSHQCHNPLWLACPTLFEVRMLILKSQLFISSRLVCLVWETYLWQSGVLRIVLITLTLSLAAGSSEWICWAILIVFNNSPRTEKLMLQFSIYRDKQNLYRYDVRIDSQKTGNLLSDESEINSTQPDRQRDVSMKILLHTFILGCAYI